jgi:hypothetical protein
MVESSSDATGRSNMTVMTLDGPAVSLGECQSTWSESWSEGDVPARSAADATRIVMSEVIA